ncbi:glycosyltransferase family 4 protein [Lunatibacter salilacus]|uniref:glycosyltransferase family 4 protein n=1 Tax=Lunatibacter salilacus TaxID=2483804 RepID=UPI00131BB71A|nr:glycosyltransferase family 4 protein [Lunatibacter salilacus]
MKVLFVCRSYNGLAKPFILEQANSLHEYFGVEIQFFFIEKGGIRGYLLAAFRLVQFLRKNTINLIHVHYGLSALPVIFTKLFFLRKEKIIITFHGSDINKLSERYFSLLASKFSAFNILVSTQMEKFFSQRYAIIPCGIDIDIVTNYREMVRMEKGWGEMDFIVLFSSSFDRKVKDPDFALKIMKKFENITKKNVHFFELKGFNRAELTKLMQAADAMLMCSFREGSPQIIKESILNSLPIISNDVGEVKSICKGIDNCYVVEKRVKNYVEVLQELSNSPARIKNRNPLLTRFSNKNIAAEIFQIYRSV